MSEQTAIVTRPYDARMAAKPPVETDHETAFYDSAGSCPPNNLIEAIGPVRLVERVDSAQRTNPCSNATKECPKRSESLLKLRRFAPPNTPKIWKQN